MAETGHAPAWRAAVTETVLDATALLGLLQKEPGADRRPTDRAVGLSNQWENKQDGYTGAGSRFRRTETREETPASSMVTP